MKAWVMTVTAMCVAMAVGCADGSSGVAVPPGAVITVVCPAPASSQSNIADWEGLVVVAQNALYGFDEQSPQWVALGVAVPYGEVFLVPLDPVVMLIIPKAAGQPVLRVDRIGQSCVTTKLAVTRLDVSAAVKWMYPDACVVAGGLARLCDSGTGEFGDGLYRPADSVALARQQYTLESFGIGYVEVITVPFWQTRWTEQLDPSIGRVLEAVDRYLLTDSRVVRLDAARTVEASWPMPDGSVRIGVRNGACYAIRAGFTYLLS